MLKKTALHEDHLRLGGRMVDFGGWDLPVQYTSVLEEHLACRSSAGLFDVSHMGEFHVEGPGSEAFLNYLITNDASKLAVGQALYSVLCAESGGIVDDLVVYRRASENFLVVVNASNTDKDFVHFETHLKRMRARWPDVRLENASSRYSQIALQGRLSQEILAPFSSVNLGEIRTYWFKEGKFNGGINAIFARTGYTGEDGFEIYVPWEAGPQVWRTLLEAGKPRGLLPCGLGARDTLRLEMKYPLYGQELTMETHPLEAGLGWVVKMDKSEFVGREALLKAPQERKLVGLQMIERGIPRHGYTVLDPTGRGIGVVTSGTQSPSLRQAIAIAYVAKDFAAKGTRLGIDIRGTAVKAEVVPTPFYKRPY